MMQGGGGGDPEVSVFLLYLIRNSHGYSISLFGLT